MTIRKLEIVNLVIRLERIHLNTSVWKQASPPLPPCRGRDGLRTVYVLIFAVYKFSLYSRMNPRTRKLNTRENLSWHCFATCIRPTAISWTPKAIKNIVTLILSHACSYIECALNRKIADLTLWNCENKNPQFFLSASPAIREKFILAKTSTCTVYSESHQWSGCAYNKRVVVSQAVRRDETL